MLATVYAWKVKCMLSDVLLDVWGFACSLLCTMEYMIFFLPKNRVQKYLAKELVSQCHVADKWHLMNAKLSESRELTEQIIHNRELTSLTCFTERQKLCEHELKGIPYLVKSLESWLDQSKASVPREIKDPTGEYLRTQGHLLVCKCTV